MHKHPTPVSIKAEIYKALCMAAAKNSLLASDVTIALQAIDDGIAQANKDHDEFRKAMGYDQ